jgi:hypothetical protein
MFNIVNILKIFKNSIQPFKKTYLTKRLKSYSNNIKVRLSALTERRKREIEHLYNELKKKSQSKVLLYVICDIADMNSASSIVEEVMKSIKIMNGIESVSYSYGTNVITVVALWNEIEANSKVDAIKKIDKVIDVKAKILSPLF